MEVGDRVRHATCGAGSIIDTAIENEMIMCFLVEFDNEIPSGHSGSGRGRQGHCWVCSSKTLSIVDGVCDSIW